MTASAAADKLFPASDSAFEFQGTEFPDSDGFHSSTRSQKAAQGCLQAYHCPTALATNTDAYLQVPLYTA